MVAQRVFAQIINGRVENISVGDDYEMANWVTRQCYGNDAFAVECTQYPCGIGDLFHDNTFFRLLDDGTEEMIPYVPTAEEQVEILQDHIKVLEEKTEIMNQSIAIIASTFNDQQAAQIPALYPLWEDLPEGTKLVSSNDIMTGTEITRVRGNNGNLYNVVVSHEKESEYAPESAPLFEVINKN